MKNGFTFIEVMIIVAILGILAAVAIPAYQDYRRNICEKSPSQCTAEERRELAQDRKLREQYQQPVVTQEPHEFVEGMSRSYTKCIAGTIYLVTDGRPVQVLDARNDPIPCNE